jgi:hypothetical protein
VSIDPRSADHVNDAWQRAFPNIANKVIEANRRKNDALRSEGYTSAADLVESRIETYSDDTPQERKDLIIRLNHERRTIVAILHRKATELATADCVCGHPKIGHGSIGFDPFRCLNCKCLQYAPEKP